MKYRSVIFLVLASVFIMQTPVDARIWKSEAARLAYIRSQAAKAAFAKLKACPSTLKHIPSCPGYIIDHIIPLCDGGADKPSNMQWQTLAASYKKDIVERRVCACHKAGHLNCK